MPQFVYLNFFLYISGVCCSMLMTWVHAQWIHQMVMKKWHYQRFDHAQIALFTALMKTLISCSHYKLWLQGKLLRAVVIRRHAGLLDIAKGLKEGQIPQIQYHCKCHSIFTMKKTLDSILSKGVCAEPEKVSSRRSSRVAPPTSRVYDKICFFLQQVKKVPEMTEN